jgi:hypothetical protein
MPRKSVQRCSTKAQGDQRRASQSDRRSRDRDRWQPTTRPGLSLCCSQNQHLVAPHRPGTGARAERLSGAELAPNELPAITTGVTLTRKPQLQPAKGGGGTMSAACRQTSAAGPRFLNQLASRPQSLHAATKISSVCRRQPSSQGWRRRRISSEWPFTVNSSSAAPDMPGPGNPPLARGKARRIFWYTGRPPPASTPPARSR